MKVKELIEKLKEYDDELEVKTRNRYTEDMKPVTQVTEKYISLDKTIIYIG